MARYMLKSELEHDLGTEIEVLAGLKSGESGTTVTIAP